MKQTLDEPNLKDKIPEDDRKKIAEACEEALKWLEANQLADKEEFEHHQKDLEAICKPVITKLYESAGAGAGGMPGGMPGGFPGAPGGGAPGAGAAPGGGSGPTIEEVD